MKPTTFVHIIIFSLIFQYVAFGQQSRKGAISYDTDYLPEEFRLPGGITGNNVNCIVEGPYGFLWFGTHGGLIRYDGYEFVTYGPVEGDTLGETTSLTFPYIENLYWDRFKKLWVTTYGGGLYRFDPETETFKHFKADPDDPGALPNNQVMCAIEDSRGELWFGTAKGLSCFDRKTEKFTSYFANPADPKSLRHDQVHNLYVDKLGVLWIATGQVLWGPESGGISRYHPETNSFSNFGYKKSPEDKSYLGAVRPMLEDREGNFWVGTTDNLFKMDRQAGTFEKMPFDPHAPHAPGVKELIKVATHAIYEDRAGGLWVGTIGATNYSSHLLRYDPVTKNTQHFPIPTSAWQVYESADGTVWVAGAGVGGKVWKLSPKALEFDLQRGENIKAAFPNSKLFKNLKVNPAYHLSSPSGLAIDPATGVVWVQYYIGNYDASNFDSLLHILASYDPKNGKVEFYPLNGLTKRYRMGLQGNFYNPAGMFVDKYGKIWGTYAHELIGIYSFDPKTGAIRHFKNIPGDPNSLSSNFVVRLLQDRRGDIWAATYRAGLNRLNPETGKFKHYHFYFPGGDRPDDDFPIALVEDENGKIWVGGEYAEWSNAFISIIDPANDSVQNLQLPAHIFDNASIHSIAQQPQHGWMTFVLANKGLCEYNSRDQRFYDYNTQNGFFPFDGVASILYDRNGDLWAASRNGGDFAFWPTLGGNSATKYLFKNKSGLGNTNRQAAIGPNNGHLYFLNEEGWAEIDPGSFDLKTTGDSSKTALVDLYVMGQKQMPGKEGILSKPLWMLDEITLPNDAETFGFRFTDFNFRNTSPKYKYRLFPYETEWRETFQEPVANYYKIPPGHYQFEVKAIKENGQLSERQAMLKVTILPPWWKTWWAYTIYGLFFLTAIYFFDRYQRRRIVERERRRMLEKEAAQKREIEKAYADLKATQSQLIQSEKLASLGELTAGIAHEIQNPLNFVNNFAELSNELMDEMTEEMEKGNTGEAKAIAADIKQNLEKINHHGKRASNIVKGMLEHSRASSGVKELTDINALADEYLRLSYHGLRAKDSSFNAKMEIDFDPAVGKVEVIPQDIGRVFLNIINNAFYATQQRAGTSVGVTSSHPDTSQYEPTVSISSKRTDSGVEFRIRDNGPGIPDDVKAKIFQPFFTTKPTGQGTGLGLSISYDIVTKGHGGSLEVETRASEGTEFLIILPA